VCDATAKLQALSCLSLSLGLSSSMPRLASLAAVEVQLVMHGLDVRSLGCFARCNRATRAASASPFAWRYCEYTLVLPLADDVFAPPWNVLLKQRCARARRSTMRFCSLRLVVPYDWTRILNAVIVLNKVMRCLRILDLEYATLSAKASLALLNRPWPGLEELRVGTRCIIATDAARQFPPHAPRLHTLCPSGSSRAMHP
jgi:hypothetical protein